MTLTSSIKGLLNRFRKVKLPEIDWSEIMKNLGIIGGRVSVLYNPATRGYVLTSGGNVKELSEQEAIDLAFVIQWHRDGFLTDRVASGGVLPTFEPYIPPEGFCAHGVKLTEMPCKLCEEEKPNGLDAA